MKIAMASLMALTALVLGVPALTQGERAEAGLESSRQDEGAKQGSMKDANKLYALVKKARNDLRAMREQAGLHAHPAGPHIDPAGHHAGDSPAQRKRERGEREGHEDGGRGERGHREGGERGERGHGEGGEKGKRRERGHREGGERGERGHGEGGEKGKRREGGERGHREGRERGEKGRGEENGNRIPKMTKHVKTYKNGARLTLQYNAVTQAFVGNVVNTTKKTLSQVRVEIHLSNGLELGPTKRIDLKAGATIPVELSALDQKFSHWVTHPEAGVEEGHGPGGEESEGHAAREKGEHGGEGRRERRGEHGGEGRREGGGEGESNRPGAALRPVYNQLQLLRGEMRAFKADLAAKKMKK